MRERNEIRTGWDGLLVVCKTTRRETDQPLKRERAKDRGREKNTYGGEDELIEREEEDGEHHGSKDLDVGKGGKEERKEGQL